LRFGHIHRDSLAGSSCHTTVKKGDVAASLAEIHFKEEAMRRQFLLASIGAITLTGSAFAADLTPPPPLPIFTWTGVYLGGQIGYAWGSGNLNYTGFDPFSGLAFTTALGGSPNGVIGGVHVGYYMTCRSTSLWSASKAR
jgi:hypothetical protein